MLGSLKLQRKLIVFGIPLLMILSLIALVKSPYFIPDITIYLIVDFLFVIPFVYFLLIRKTKISNKTTFSFALLGLVVASIILPKENQQIIYHFKQFVLPLVEIFVLTYVGIKLRKAIRKVKDSSLDFHDLTFKVCSEIMPLGISHFLASEISVFYYGLFNWKRKKLKENEFTYHKEGTANSVILGFLLVVFVEMFVTHSMIQSENKTGAIILGGLSIYTAIQVIAVLRSLAKRPVFIDVKNQQLVLKFGILAKAIIPFSKIKSVEVSSKEFQKESEIKYFAPLGSAAGHNLILFLTKEIEFVSFYGFKKKAKSLAVFIDKKNNFTEELMKYINYEK